MAILGSFSLGMGMPKLLQYNISLSGQVLFRWGSDALAAACLDESLLPADCELVIFLLVQSVRLRTSVSLHCSQIKDETQSSATTTRP